MAHKYDHEYKVQAVKLAKEIGGAKATKELEIPKGGKRISEGRQRFFRRQPSRE